MKKSSSYHIAQSYRDVGVFNVLQGVCIPAIRPRNVSGLSPVSGMMPSTHPMDLYNALGGRLLVAKAVTTHLQQGSVLHAR